MLRKTTPAPIFNYRKRQRQAVYADPESQPTNTGNRNQAVPVLDEGGDRLDELPKASLAEQIRERSRGSRDSAYLQPPPLSPTTRQSMPVVTPGSEKHVLVGYAGPGHTEDRRNVRCLESQVKKSNRWREERTTQDTVLPPPAAPICPSRHRYKNQLHQPGAAESSVFLSTPHPRQPKVGARVSSGGEGEVGVSSNKTLRVLKVPIVHLKPVFQLQIDAIPALVCILYGILDSATVWNRATSGKSFVLRDETGSVTCIFCEIDRQIPVLHRGQWYRAVCAIRPTLEAMQCLSIRTMTMEERQAARHVTVRCTALLNDTISNVIEQ
ncbi:uncharacterized protein [Littorina saxatilis]|uniref:Uncharacterized protein n=1 Tax=Littorina saxatilis TaxID=31220 RepID=A0AAN9FWZ8_9CAEN